MGGDLGCTGIVWLTLSALAALGAGSGFFLPYWLRGAYLPPPPHPPPTPSSSSSLTHTPPPPASHSPLPPPSLLYPTPVFLGTFRRCNYLRLVDDDDDNFNNLDSDRRRSSDNDDGGDDDGDSREGRMGPSGVRPSSRSSSSGSSKGGSPISRGVVVGAGRLEMVLECGRYSSFADIPSVWWQIGTVICGAGSALALLVAMAAAWALCVRYVLTKGTAKVAAALQLLASFLIGGGVALYPLGWGSREVRQVCGPSASAFRLGDCELFWAFYLTASSAGMTLLCSLLALCAPSSKADYS